MLLMLYWMVSHYHVNALQPTFFPSSFCSFWPTIFYLYFSSPSFINVGSDAILLGAETLRGLYPVETISTVGRICAEVSY